MLAWLTGKLAIGIAGVLVAALLVILYLRMKDQRDVARGEASTARMETNVARAEEAHTKSLLDVERQSTLSALAAQASCEAQGKAKGEADDAAMASLRASAASCRKSLNSCKTPAAIQHRLGAATATSRPWERP